MAGTIKRLAGPAYIAASATDIFAPAASTIYSIIRHIHVANKSAAAATFSLYLGVTGGSAAGTELFGTVTVAAYSTFDYYCYMKTLSTEYLSGIAGTGSALVITVEGEQVVV